MKITVNYIREEDTGEYYTSEELIGTDKIVQFKLRHEIEQKIQKSNSKYVCAICRQPVKLRAGEHNRFYFAHLKDSDDCPIKTDTKYTKREWEAIKYHGAKEGPKHKKLKRMLYDILKNDERFTDIKIEKAVKDIDVIIRWKKPDIQCNYKNKKCIFEIQISHTFLSVIVARELFYQDNEMPLFWIFDYFEPEPDYIKVFQGDIFFHNNCNLMVLNDEVYEYSIKNKRVHFKTYWLEPYISNRQIFQKWNCKIIDFDKITFDEKKSRAYYYDYERNLKLQNYELRKELIFDIIRSDGNYSKRIDLFHTQINSMDEFNLKRWNDKKDVYKLYDLFRILLSIKERKNYGYKNQNIIWMLNIFYDANRDLYWIVLNYIKNTKFEEVLSHEKKYSTFLNHKNDYLRSNPIRNNRYADYLHWYFPEIKEEENGI
jgi:competence CoiA-like predicted nuclease